jgi:hypothetical protein
VDDWHDHAATANSRAFRFEKGRAYEIKLEYYENGGLASVALGWNLSPFEETLRPAVEAARQSDVAVLVLGAIVLASVGCGPKKPELFRVRGRIIEAEMKQPLSGVRLVLRATFPADVGKTTLKSFGMTRADGSYDVELAEGFAVLREAAEIGLDAAKPGYTPVSVGVPVPIRSAPFYKMGDIVMKRSAVPLREGPPPPPPRGLFRDDPPPRRR